LETSNPTIFVLVCTRIDIDLDRRSSLLILMLITHYKTTMKFCIATFIVVLASVEAFSPASVGSSFVGGAKQVGVNSRGASLAVVAQRHRDCFARVQKTRQGMDLKQHWEMPAELSF
jgi:hypothetical protein